MSLKDSNVDKFQSKISHHRFWKYFEIKAFLLKYWNDTIWKIAFLYIRLLPKKIPVQKILLNVSSAKLIHEVHHFHEFENFLTQISYSKTIKIGGSYTSLELMTSALKFKYYERNHPFPALFGINDAGYGLSQTGRYSEQLGNMLLDLQSELPKHFPPFESMRDAISSLLGLDF